MFHRQARSLCRGEHCPRWGWPSSYPCLSGQDQDGYIWCFVFQVEIAHLILCWYWIFITEAEYMIPGLIYIDRRCTQVLRLKLLGTEERFSWKVITGDRVRERIITMMTMTSTTRVMMINWWWRNIVQDVQRGGGESTQPDHTPGRFFFRQAFVFFLWLSQTCGSKVLNIDIVCVLPRFEKRSSPVITARPRILSASTAQRSPSVVKRHKTKKPKVNICSKESLELLQSSTEWRCLAREATGFLGTPRVLPR